MYGLIVIFPPLFSTIIGSLPSIPSSRRIATGMLIEPWLVIFLYAVLMCCSFLGIYLWVYRYVDGGELHANDEVAMLDLLETYGFDFPYVPPSKPTKAEQKRIQIMTGGNENA